MIVSLEAKETEIQAVTLILAVRMNTLVMKHMLVGNLQNHFRISERPGK